MDKQQSLDNFHLICAICEAKGIKHKTVLHVDWEKKYYMMLCYTCKNSESFDEYAHPIKDDDTKNPKESKIEEKCVN